MYRQNSCEWMMNRDTSHITIMYISCHMEMRAISSYNFWLTTMCKFSITNFTYQPKILTPSHHEMRSIVFLRWSFTSHNFDISCQEANLCSHWEFLSSVYFNSCIMFISERLSYSDSSSRNTLDNHLLCLLMIKASWGYSDFLSWLPINRINNTESFITSRDGRTYLSPSLISWFPMKIEHTIFTP